jgi:integrase
LEQQGADHGPADGAWINTGLVFTTRHGTTVEPRSFSRGFDRCITRAQAPRITVHGARKTCESLRAAFDVRPRAPMQILRHSTIAVTTEIYAEVPSAATRDALGKLAQWLDPDSWPAEPPTAALCSCTNIKHGRLHDHNWPLSWVGDTAIEPVTSSV